MNKDDDIIMNFESLYEWRIMKGFSDTDELQRERGTLGTKYRFPEVDDILDRVHEENRLIILTDIANFSMNTSRNQINLLYFFQFYVGLYNATSNDHITVRDFVSTGDGCYMIADECNARAAVLSLLKLIAGCSRLRDDDNRPVTIRVGALIGKCIPFIDVTGNKNYIGEGMNEAQRILSCGQHALEDALRRDKTLSGADVTSLSGNSLYLGDSLADITDDVAAKAERVFRFDAVPDKHGITRNITVLQGVHPMDDETFFRERDRSRDEAVKYLEAHRTNDDAK